MPAYGSRLIEINANTYWKFTIQSDDSIHLVRKIDLKGSLELQDTSGPFWIFGRMEVLRGSLKCTTRFVRIRAWGESLRWHPKHGR
jgi:hypothetical protein